MAGKVYLHPIQRTGQLAYTTKENRRLGKMTYVFPSSELVARYRSKVVSNSSQVFTMDQMVKRIVGDEGEHISPYFRYKCIESCMDEGVAEGWFADWRNLSVESFAWIVKVEQWVGEMKRAGVTPTRLRGLLPKENSLHQALVNLYERYQQKLKQNAWMDQEEVYYQAMNHLKRMNLAGEIFIFEQFYDLHYIQENLLVELVSRGAEVELHLVYDHGRSSFQSVKPMLQRLQKVGFAIEDLSEVLRSNALLNVSPCSALQHVKQSLFVSQKRVQSFESSDTSVQIWKENHKTLEVRRAIRKVKEWLLDSQLSADQIALVTQQWDVYAPLVRRIASEAGIPFELSKIQTGIEHWMGQVIRSAFACKDGDINTIPYLSRWAGIELSNWESTSNPWRKLNQSSEEVLQCWLEAVDLEDEEHVTNLWNWIQQIPKVNHVQDWFPWLLSWAEMQLRPNVKVFQDDQSLQSWNEDQRFWMELERWCQEIGKRKGLSRSLWSANEFAEETTNWLSSLQIVVEPGERGGVKLLHASMIRGHTFSKVILLGCEEGNWPALYQDDWLCPDRLRMELHQEYIWLLTSQELQERQMLPFIMSVMSAQDQIVFSYSTRGQTGEPQNLSSYVSEVLRCFPNGYFHKASLSDHSLSPSRWISRKDVMYATIRESVGKSDHFIDQSFEKLMELGLWRALTLCEIKEGIRIIRSRSMQISSPWFGQCRLEEHPSVLSTILAQKVWSASELEVLMSCRFRYLAERVWKIHGSESQGRGLSRLDAGNALHASLYALYKWFREQGGDWQMFQSQRSEIEVLYDEISNDLYQKYPYVVAEIEKRKEKRKFTQFWELEVKGRTGGIDKHPLQPTFLELSFGLPIHSPEQVDPQSKREPVTISLTKDLVIQVKGKMDRVDSDGEHIVVYDYKTGSSLPKPQELINGKAIQLPLYLWVLQDGFGYSEEQIIGGAIYTNKRRSLGIWKANLVHQKANVNKSVKGLDSNQWSEIQIRMKQILAKQIQALQSGDVAVKPTWDCPSYCLASRLCRYQNQGLNMEGCS